MLEIRTLARDDDFNAIGDIYVQSWRKGYRGLLPDDFLEKLTHDRWSAMLRADPFSSLVLLEDGRPIGTAMLSFARQPGREGFGEVMSVCVLPSHEGRGHGRRLLEAALNQFAEEGYENVCLWVLSSNRNVRGFYRHMGFVPTSRTLHEMYAGKSYAMLEYARSVRLNTDEGGNEDA